VSSEPQLDTLTVVLLEPVGLAQHRAQFPSNDSERLLYRNLFHTLVRMDCNGSVRPALASTWTSDPSGASWTFALRQSVSFAPGWSVSPYHVTESLAGPLSSGRVLGIDSAVELDDTRLRVYMRDRDSIPRILADPSLAVVTGLAKSGDEDGGIQLPADGSRPVIDFRFEPNSDARDALDRGADLLVTRDPRLVDYARGLPEFGTFPLPWSRSYVLVQPAAAEPLDVVGTDLERRSLARDAVQADARGAEPPFWWNEATCPARTAAAARSESPSTRVAYIRGDEVARALAERVVALAQSATGLRTVALEPAEFTALVHKGSEWAYVVALPRRTLAPCRESAALPDGARIQPLIDTRAHAIVRRGSPPLTIEWDGTVRVVEP
jgi:hypothetical protein